MTVHPTIDEQLRGAVRLLDVLETDEELSPASRETLANVRRLLGKVGRSWSAQLPFHRADSLAVGELLTRLVPLVGADLAVEIENALGAADRLPDLDARSVAGRNAQLRALLSRVITELPHSPEGDAARAEIGDYLRQRVDTDPT